MITLEMPTRIRELMDRYLTVAEYHALGRDGTLTPADRVELIRGRLVAKVVKNPPHRRTITRINERIVPMLLGSAWELGIESPVSLSDSEPDPDFSVVRKQAENAEDTTPVPAECGLVIEVSDSSLRADRTEMYELYAEAKIPIYWIVNIPDRQVEVYENPSELVYLTKAVYRDGESVPVVLGGEPFGSVAVSDILPGIAKA